MNSIISKFTLFFCFCLSILFGLAIFENFEKKLILITLIISSLIFLFYIFWQILKRKIKFEKFDLIVFSLILLFSLFLIIFHHDLPRGRDEASYMSAAIKLSETKSLVFEDKLTHSFTGFRNLENNTFTSQFLPGYIVYLATYYKLGGINTLFLANFLLILLSFLYIYLIAKNLDGKTTAIFIIILFTTFYTTFWSPRRFVSENLFMTLFWASIFLFFEGYQKKIKSYFLLGLIPMILTLFVRGEAIAFFLIYLTISFFLLKKENFLHYYNRFKRLILINIFTLFIIINLSFFVYYLKIYKGLNYFFSQFYSPLNFFISIFKFSLPILLILTMTFLIIYILKKTIFTKIIKFLKINFQKILFFIILSIIGIYEIIIISHKNFSWNFYQIQYNIKVFTFSFLVFYILLILYGLYNNLFKKEEFLLTLFVLPSFLFLLSSQIAQDLPWFLRRFYPVFIPYIFLMTAIINKRISNLNQKINFLSLSFLHGRVIITTISLFLVASNLFFSLPIIAFSENRNIRPQLEKFSKKFENEDLIIMTPGWDWQKWAYPLHYYYKLQILPNLNNLYQKKITSEIKKLKKEKIKDNEFILKIKKEFDKKSFEEFKNLIHEIKGNIYLLAEKNDLIIYPYSEKNLQFIENIVWKYNYLIPTPMITKYINQNSKNLNLYELNKKISEIPPQTITKKELELKLYKVKNKNEFVFPERQYTEEDIEDFRKTLNKWLLK